MKILFVMRDMQMFERAGIMTLSAMLKQGGHETDLIQTDFEDIDKKMQEYKPEILAYSITTGEHNHMTEINKELKKKYRFVSVFGGPHPTFSPEMIEKEGVDVVCVGEGEYAFLELANALRDKKPVDNIKNLWIKRKGKIIKNNVRPLIQNLDELPFLDLEIMYEHNQKLKEHGEKRMLISRGCPYRCTYCANHKFADLYGMDWGKVRRYSVDRIIREAIRLKDNYLVEFIRFTDDTFVACSKEWLDEFAKRWKNEINTPFLCNVRANLVTPYLVKKLKEAGCYSVFMAIEAADEEVRNKLLRRNMSEEDIARAYKLLKEQKIKIGYYNLLGLPVKNSLEKDFKTLKMNIKYKPTMAWSSIFTPYPHTELADYSIKHGYFKGDFDKIPANNKISSCLNFDEKEKRQIDNLHKFFGITVQFPFLLPLVRLLIKLPRNSLYVFLMYAFYGYTLKVRMSTLKMPLTRMFGLAKTLTRIMKE